MMAAMAEATLARAIMMPHTKYVVSSPDILIGFWSEESREMKISYCFMAAVPFIFLSLPPLLLPFLGC
jgi:hypothetical protein